jgi:hypothetical protein
MLLLKILPGIQANPPAWMTEQERATLARLVGELMAATVTG